MLELSAPIIGSAKAPNKIILTYTFPQGDNPPETADFNITTYRKLANESASIEATCDLVNEFLRRFSEDEVREYFLYCREMKQLLVDLRPGLLHPTIQVMADKTAKICQWLNLAEQAVKYVSEAGIPIPQNLSKVPKRIQDTAEKTFDDGEYRLLTGISIVCKVLSPVLGECIAAMEPPVADKANKELFTFMLLVPVLETGVFSKVFEKLTPYIEDLTTKAINDLNNRLGGNEPSIAFTLAKNGVDEARFRELVHSMIYVKKLVTFDVWSSGKDSGRGPDIMVYIYVSVFETARSKLNTIKHQSNVLARFEQNDNGSGTQDNATHLENVARVSKITADIPLVAEFGIEIIIPKLLESYAIPPAIFDRALRYHDVNFVVPSAFSRALIASLLGKFIGGSTMLLYLKRPLYTKVLLITQMFLLRNGFTQLGVLISSKTPDVQRNGPSTGVAHRIMSNYEKTASYKTCLSLFPGFSEKSNHRSDPSGRNSTGEDFISIGNQIKRLLTWLSEYDHYYNVAPATWELVGVDADRRPDPGSIIQYDETTMDQLCQFFISQHTGGMPPV